MRGGTPRGARIAGTKANELKDLKIRTSRKTLRWPERATGPAAPEKVIRQSDWAKPEIKKLVTPGRTELYTVLAQDLTSLVG